MSSSSAAASPCTTMSQGWIKQAGGCLSASNTSAPVPPSVTPTANAGEQRTAKQMDEAISAFVEKARKVCAATADQDKIVCSLIDTLSKHDWSDLCGTNSQAKSELKLHWGFYYSRLFDLVQRAPKARQDHQTNLGNILKSLRPHKTLQEATVMCSSPNTKRVRCHFLFLDVQIAWFQTTGIDFNKIQTFVGKNQVYSTDTYETFTGLSPVCINYPPIPDGINFFEAVKNIRADISKRVLSAQNNDQAWRIDVGVWEENLNLLYQKKELEGQLKTLQEKLKNSSTKVSVLSHFNQSYEQIVENAAKAASKK